MPKRFPESVKLNAMKLFVTGDKTAKQIAEIISKDGDEVKPVTIYAWAKQYGWGEQKNMARSENQKQIAETEGQRFARLQQEQLESYTSLASKAYKELDGLHFDRAFDAVKAVDIGIKGQREVLSGLVSLGFVQEILAVLVEEISDQKVLEKIALKLNTLVQNQEDIK
tara:strand:- start:1046 stop:1549 length:504 start_codon:yes stop_codon:yes gene_type:complete